VLDLFAGSGALGVEALSRGAESAVFVERSAPVLAILRENLEGLDLTDSTRTFGGLARAALPRFRSAGERFDLVFLDPPYDGDELEATLTALVRAEVLEPGATLLAEAPRRTPPGEISGLERSEEWEYGETTVVRYISGPVASDAPEGRRSVR